MYRHASLRRVNSALDFLYPQGVTTAGPASEVVLKLPLRVGLAFAPNRALNRKTRQTPSPRSKSRGFSPGSPAHSRSTKAIGNLEVVPTAYLQPGGSFANLEQLRRSLGLDLMVLLSYDRHQFTESTRASWTYFTVVGPS